MESAIEWLADTILATLQIGKLGAWIRRAGLADDTEKLRREVERVELLVRAVRSRSAGNAPPARSLARLRELLYEADDVVDDLDYCRLQQQVQGGTRAISVDPSECADLAQRSRGGDADIPSSSGGKKQSKAWDDFDIIEEDTGKPVKAKCKHCQQVVECRTDKWTSVLHNHVMSEGCKKKLGATDQPPNPSSSSDPTENDAPIVTCDSFGRKRRRDEDSALTPTSIHSWHRAEFSNRIQEITRQLQDVQEDVRDTLKLHGSSFDTSSNHCRSTSKDDVCPTSSLNQQKKYRRDSEKNTIIKMITAEKHESVSVLPIVGIGGVGKTALTQLIYNDPLVKEQFERILLSVSNNLDEVRLTREILDFVSQERHEGISSFAKLQEILKIHMEFQSKRFLLILDDVWDNLDAYLWNTLLSPMMSGHVKGNVIVVTTRNFSVAKRIGTLEPINLGALANDDFWLLFKSCAFGDENYEGHQSLSIIGHQIAEKLMGNPLAAGSTGKLLRKQLTIDHWSNILNNERWKSLHLSRGIMPALKLSYDQLPYYLQQCFSYISIFPCNHQFLGDELVRIWTSQGFVKCNDSGEKLDETGQCYLTDLVNLGFFQQVESKDRRALFQAKIFSMRSNNPVAREESFTGNQTCYGKCGLMHDFARIVSRSECAVIDDLQCNEMLPTVQHLSVVTDSAYCKDQNGSIPRNYKFEENLRNTVTSVRRLRTLVLIGQYDSFFFQSFQDILRKAHNLRLLQMSATSSDFNSFMCTLVNPAHLLYLKALKPGMALPQVLSKLFHLQALDIGSSTYPTISNVTSLQTLHLEDCGEWQILPSLEMLPFLMKLKLCKMHKVTDATFSSLEELILIEMPKLEKCSCTSMSDLNSSLRVLHIKMCRALKVFDLFENCNNFESKMKSWLSDLRKLIIYDCPHLQVMHPLPPSTNCFELFISRVSTFPMERSSRETLEIGDLFAFHNVLSYEMRALDDRRLAFHNLRDLKYLCIRYCRNLMSIPFKGFSQLVSLKRLQIIDCGKLFSSDIPEHTYEDMVAANFIALPYLEHLDIRLCGIAVKWLSLMLRHAPALMVLKLGACPQITQLSIEEEENSQSNLISTLQASSSGYLDYALASSAPEGLLHIPLTLLSTLKEMDIAVSPYLTFKRSMGGLSGFTDLGLP
ncbi:hypothetical protein ACQ4PT_011394 [Festuca glaucescens]